MTPEIMIQFEMRTWWNRWAWWSFYHLKFAACIMH